LSPSSNAQNIPNAQEERGVISLFAYFSETPKKKIEKQKKSVAGIVLDSIPIYTKNKIKSNKKNLSPGPEGS